MASRNTISIRYYLWADDGPWRLASRLHQDLIARKVALPQHAGTKQKILEVFARWITRDTFSLKGRGSICPFDADGFLEPSGAEELVGLMVDRLHGPRVAALFFIVPAIGMLTVLGTLSSTWAPLAVGLIGLGLGAEVDLSAFLLSRYIGLRSFGEVYGYLFGIFMVGASAGPFVMGVVFDRAGSYTPCLLAFVALLFAAALLVLMLGPYAFPPAGNAGGSPLGASPNSASASPQ